MYYYVYEIKCLVNGKIYIGAHKTSDINDGYIGSGNLIKSAMKKYGVHNFEKRIVKFFDTEKEMFDYEAEIVNEDFLKRNDVYNLSLGGLGGDRSKFISEDTRLKRSERFKGQGNPFYGEQHSPETRLKISQKLLEKDEEWRRNNASNAGSKNLGKKRSEESRLNYSKAAKERNLYTCEYCGKQGQYNSMIGYHGEKCRSNPSAPKRIWVNNGVKNMLVIETDIPKGYKKGRKENK